MKAIKCIMVFCISWFLLSCENPLPDVDNPNYKEEVFFEISRDTFDVSSNGGEVETMIFTNRSWFLSGEYTWCRPSITSGEANENGYTISFTIDETKEDRVAIFWIRCTEKQIRVTINQTQTNTIISKTETDFQVPSEGGIIEIVYGSNVECKIIISNNDSSWISIDSTRAYKEEAHTVVVAENNEYEPRTANIKVVSLDETLKEVYTIHQDASPAPYIEVSTNIVNFGCDASTQRIDIISNSNWVVESENCDWIDIAPVEGKGNDSIIVSATHNPLIDARETTIKVYALSKLYGKWKSEAILITQEPNNEGLLFYENFDSVEATKTYGTGSSWPYIDEFPQFANPMGDGAENVTYSGYGVYVQSTSPSNGSYSDYDGSGLNNLLFGYTGYMQINDIKPDMTTTNYTLTFGAEKQAKSGRNIFSNSEFHIYLSKNGSTWVEIDYDCTNVKSGRWNLVRADFTFSETPENIYIRFVSDISCAYRIDDVKLYLNISDDGQQVTLPEKSDVTKTLLTFKELGFYNAADFVNHIGYEHFTDYEGYAILPIEIEFSSEKHGAYFFDVYDWTGRQESDYFTDKHVIESLLWSIDMYGSLVQPYTYNFLQFGRKYELVGIVLDEAGQVSDFHRQWIEPTQETCRNASDYVTWWDSHNPNIPADGIYESDSAFVCVINEDSKNAVFGLNETILNGELATGFKLGKSKQAGRFTSSTVSASGTKYLNFYAVGWKGHDVTLYYRVDGGPTYSQKLASDNGATGNPPYNALELTAEDHYSVKLDGLTESSRIEFSTDANFELTTSESTMTTARAVICGVKLTDEPIIVK